MPTLGEQLDVARADFETARAAAESLANEEAGNLGSDEAYHSWHRRKRVAEIEVERLAATVPALETAIVDATAKAVLDEYEARYNAAAARNREVAAMLRDDLPRAWAIVSTFLEAAALAEIETAEVLRLKPAGFVPSRWIGDPEAGRRRSSLEEEIVREEVAELWIDAETGHLFADQTRRPTKKALTKQFKQVTYLPSRRGDNTQPFFRDLHFPRIDQSGPALFDGRNLHSPHDVLRALRAPRPELPPRHPQMRISPVNSLPPPVDDFGPSVS